MSTPADDEPLPEGAVQTFDQVAAANSAFYAETVAEGFDENKEARSLRSLLDGSSRGAAESAAEAIGRSAQVPALRAAWEPWRAIGEDVLGRSLKQVVVDDLDAPHLKPSGIESRLVGGLHAAAHGLFQLVNSLPAGGPAEKEAPR